MNDNVWLAMLALAEPVLPEVEPLADGLRELWPSAPAVSQANTAGNVLTFALGEATVALTLVPQPIRPEDLVGPCECAWYWPDAGETLARHTAHLLITLVDEGRDPIDKAMLVSWLVAAASWLTPALGIYWGPGRLVHSPQPFREQLGDMSREKLPLYLWIDFRVEPESNDRLRLFTTGIQAFGHDEIEVTGFRGDASDLVQLVFNVVHYVLEKSKSLNDGDTVAVGGTARGVTARSGKSLVDRTTPVVYLEIGPGK